MGAEMNPARAILAVCTAGTSEAIIGGAKLAAKVIPFPTTCCGCISIYHTEISDNMYHCRNCGSHCGHVGTVCWRYCDVCGKQVKFVVCS